jgi:hypothetical protein
VHLLAALIGLHNRADAVMVGTSRQQMLHFGHGTCSADAQGIIASQPAACAPKVSPSAWQQGHAKGPTCIECKFSACHAWLSPVLRTKLSPLNACMT